jgi:tRNA threonylcarbamoyladenosine biosynthesis protein TsaB
LPPDTLTLGFDTSAAHCAAALLSGDRVLAARVEAMAKGQAERLLSLLEEVLAEAGVHWRDLSAIGVGIGPGNFTGVRISVAAARGLALALNVPAIGITTLEARAHALPRPLAVVEDARRDQVYLQRFEAGADHAPELLPLADLPERVGTMALTGSAAQAAALTGGAVLTPALPLAEAIAQLAAARAGTAQPRPAPLYPRAADAALPTEPPPVILP